jgi:hypothetical protein
MSAAPIRLHPRNAVESSAAPALLAEFSFAGGGASPQFGDGWGLPEEIMRWSLGDRSNFTISLPPHLPLHHDERIAASILAAPYLAQNPKASQRITVWVNDRVVHQTVLGRAGLISVSIPSAALGAPISFRFEHPDAVSPATCSHVDDRRRLAFAFRRLQIWSLPPPPGRTLQLEPLAQANPAEYMAQFDSLGDNCEFGIAQRLSGCEPLGLLRFTATPLPALVDLLLHEFEGLGDPATVSFDLRGDRSEYILTEHRYGLTYHTFTYADEMPEDRVRRRETQKLTLMRRRMRDELRDGRRIYTIKYNEGLRDEDVWSLFLLLRHFGPNRLLYVTRATPDHAPGTVELLTPGLARAYIDRFAPYEDAARVSLDCWHTICRNAGHLLPRAAA